APSLVAAISLAVMGLGLTAYAGVDSVESLALYSVVWSLGFHCWIPLESTMALTYSPDGNKGRWLGQLRSIHSLAWLLAIVACMYLLPHIRYEGLFVLAGVCTVIGGGALLFAPRKSAGTEERGFVFKRRYTLFYLLNFLQGCRKQMFITFAIFALVKVHGMPVETTMILVLINQTLLTLTSPILGRMVDRFGERLMLTFSYCGLIFVFLGYALVEDLGTLYVLYCIDNLIFFGSIALTTYAHKITPSDELKPTLAMGVTMNHVAAVLAPLIGGLVWHFFGYQIIFLTGAALALVSLVVCQWVRTESPTPIQAD
ncbi:MAG: MFS transporter, partial [Candidatus Latescibacteria bacterium]|nr:MFS transporter [Candidatus Latescibacterota bacterium]